MSTKARYRPPDALCAGHGSLESRSKAELIELILRMQKEAIDVHALLDGYQITRENLHAEPGTVLTLYGRVYAAMHLLRRAGEGSEK